MLIFQPFPSIYNDGELMKDSTISKMEIVWQEGTRYGKRKQTFYNLDDIISVGYRVNSRRTQSKACQRYYKF